MLAKSMGNKIVGLTSFTRTSSLYRMPGTFSLYTHHIVKRFTCSEDVIVIGRKYTDQATVMH
jgi:hypothetical protein